MRDRREVMPPLEIVGLAGAAMVAGAMNAVAGGGTLVTFPTLLYYGTSPVIANATSTLALLIGTAGSVFGYREHVGKVMPWLKTFIPVSIVGGLMGSALLTHTSERTFSKLVPFLILFATLLFLAQGFFKRFAGSSLSSSDSPTASAPSYQAALWFQLAVAIYGGYFGAGIGILMLASLAFLGLQHIHEMNTIKTVLGSLINLVATVWFIAAGLIEWPKAGVMTIGAVLGYYLGSRFAQSISQQAVRWIVTSVGFGISAVTFYKEFLR